MGNHSEYEKRLGDLPFVVDVQTSTASLRLLTSAGPVSLPLRVERSFLSQNSVDRLLSTSPIPLMLFAPLVAGALALRLQKAGVNYVDQAGNLHLTLGEQYMAHIEGKNLPSQSRPAGIRSAGYRVLFALMAWPELAGQSQREIAAVAGTSRTAVASLLRRLTDEGALLGRGQRRRLIVNDRLLQRWRVGYADVLRPSLFIRRYKLPDGGLEVLERRLDHLATDRYAWGGGVAAAKLGGTFMGERVTLHVQAADAALPLTPNDQGAVHVLSIPGPLAWPGSVRWDGGGVRAAHPLVLYAELLDAGTDRALGAARDLAERFQWGLH